MTILIANPSNVVTQIKAAAPGDRVHLESGTYEPLVLKKITKEPPGVVIEPAPDAEPVIPGCEANLCTGLTLDRLPFGIAVRVNTGVTLTECERMALTRLRINGGATVVQAGNPLAIRVRDCAQVLVGGCEVSNCGQGLSHLGCTYLDIDRNDFHHLYGETDAIRGASDFLRITNNRGWSFYAIAGWHTDFIQGWTANLAMSPHDIHIEGNEFRIEDGSMAQGIFYGNEDDLPYERLVIRDNCISGASSNGILAELAPDALLDLNVVVGFNDIYHANGKLIMPTVALRRNVDGAIIGNVSPNVRTIDSTGVVMEDNLIIPLSEPGDYSIADQWRERREEAAGGGGGGECCPGPERKKFRKLLQHAGAKRPGPSYQGDLPDEAIALLIAAKIAARIKAEADRQYTPPS